MTLAIKIETKNIITYFKIASILVFGYSTEYIFRIILARSLGPAGFGIINLGISYFSIGLSIAALGIPVAVAREIAFYSGLKKYSLIKSIIYKACILITLSSLLLTIVLIYFIKYFNNNWNILIFFILSIPFGIYFRLSIDVLRGLQKSFLALFNQEILNRLIKLLSVTIVILYFNSLLNLSIAFFVSYFLTCSIAWFLLNKALYSLNISSNSQYHWQNLLKIALPICGTTFFLQAFGKVEVIIMSYYVKSSYLGLYSAYLSIAQILLLPSSAIMFIFLPKYTKCFAMKENKAEAFLRETVFLLFIVGIIFLAFFSFFANTVIQLLYGKSFSSNLLIQQILLVSYLIFIVGNPFGCVLIAKQYNKQFFLSTLVGFFLIVVISFFIVPKFSGLGAAIANFIGMLSMNLMYFYFYCQSK